MVRLHVLGRLDVTGPDAAPQSALLTQAKPVALFSYLAIASPGAFHRRDHLLGIFWAETTSTRGRRALSQALHVLRNALGPDVFESRGQEEIRLRDELVRCDVAAFRNAVSDRRWAEALESYPGELLPGFFLADAPEFEQWLSTTRTSIHDAAAAAAAHARDEAIDRNELKLAVAYATRAHDLAPFDESALRHLLELLEKVGDRASAVCAYNAFAERLERELSVKPSTQTATLIADIRSREDIVEQPRERMSWPTPAGLAATSGSTGRNIQRRLIAASIVVGLVLLGGYGFSRTQTKKTAEPPLSLDARDELLVARFASAPADSALAEAVNEAITLDLSQSATLRVMSPSEIRESLRLMRTDTLMRITPAIALEVAEREGVKAVVDGHIRRAGSAFILSARLLDSRTGALIQGWRATARDSTEIIAAVDSLSASLRFHAGESIQSIRATSPLLKVSTNSMPALRKHAMALTAFYEGDFARSAALYEDAIRLDSTFADAYVSLSVALTSLGAKPARQIEAIIQAYGYRERLVEGERYGVEANYLARVKGDRQGAIDAFRNYTRVDPRGAFWGGLASLLIQSKRYADAERTLIEGFQHQSTPPMFYHLARARFGQGRFADARQALDEGEKKFPRNPIFTRARVELAAGINNHALADSIAHSIPSSGTSTALLLHQAQVDAALGKTGEAISHLRMLRASQLSAGAPGASFSALITLSRVRLHALGDTAGAVAEVESALRRRELHALDPRERPYAQLAHFFVEASLYDRARAMLLEHHRLVPLEYRQADTQVLRRTRALLAVESGDADSGIEELRRIAETDISPHAALADLIWAFRKARVPDSAAAVAKRYVRTAGMRRLEEDAFYLRSNLNR